MTVYDPRQSASVHTPSDPIAASLLAGVIADHANKRLALKEWEGVAVGLDTEIRILEPHQGSDDKTYYSFGCVPLRRVAINTPVKVWTNKGWIDVEFFPINRVEPWVIRFSGDVEMTCGHNHAFHVQELGETSDVGSRPKRIVASRLGQATASVIGATIPLCAPTTDDLNNVPQGVRVSIVKQVHRLNGLHIPMYGVRSISEPCQILFNDVFSGG